MLRAVVFDFDGVIADSEPLHYRGFRDILADEGVALSERDYYARYLGYDDVGVFNAVAADGGRSWSHGRVAELVRLKALLMERLEQETSILFPGADAAIRRTAALVPLAIASGALGAEVRRVLDREQLSSFFQAVVAAEDTSFSKPAPDPYLRAVTLLEESVGGSLRPSECVAIEDSPWGLQSAREADAVISSLDELDGTLLKRLCPD
jgi:beta-phosphoglucomutase-like phosphatase (HAD superfamily)